MKRVGRKTKVIAWFAVAAFVLFYLQQNIDQLLSFDYRIRVSYFSASLLFAVLAYAANIAIWIYVSTYCGARVGWVRHAYIWSTSRLGRYIPGKIAAIYMRIDGYVGQRPKASLSLYIETVSSLIAIFALLLTFSIGNTSPFSVLHIALMLGAAGLLAAVSFRKFIGMAADRIPILRHIEIPKGRADLIFWPTIVAMQAVVMALHGLSLYFSISSIYGVPFSVIPEITVFYYFAGVAGMLALFAPAGFGIRETVLAGLLKGIIPLPAAVAAVALVRLATILGEIIIAGAAHTLYRLSLASRPTKRSET